MRAGPLRLFRTREHVRKVAVAISFGALVFSSPDAARAANDTVIPGDQLNVTVFNRTDLTASVKVDSRGGISLPVVGYVAVAGLTLRQIDARLVALLRPYVKFPSVDVQSVGESQTIFLAGGPGGVLPFSSGETLLAALSDMEKNLTERDPMENNRLVVTDQIDHSRIDQHRIGLFRGGTSLGTFDAVALRSAGDPGPMLRANDTIVFRNKPVEVNVTGYVAKPGPAYLYENEPLSDSVEQAGGTLPSAATSHIEVSDPSAASPRFMALGDPAFARPAVQNETVYIPVAPRVQVNGLVAKPGPVALGTDFTLLGAINSAGGLNKFANIKDVQVVENGTRTSYDITKLTFGDMSQNPTLKDGDSVFVPEGHKIDFSSVFYDILNVRNTVPLP